MPRAFPTGGLVSPEDLVGREAVLRELFERVYRQRNSVVLTAPRQTGKSSVVAELLRRIREAGGWGVSVDCAAAADVEDFAALVAASTYDEATGTRGAFSRLADLARNVPRPILYHADTQLALTFHVERARDTLGQRLERALGLADELAEEAGKRVVVAYDEFPLLRKLSPRIFDQVRAALQRANRRTSYVFIGSEVGISNELFKSRRRMPFRLAITVDLPRPTDHEWMEYVERRFADLGHPLAVGEASRLVAFAGGHPRDLMEVCQHLLTIRSVGASTGADLTLAEERTLAGLRRYFEDLWNSLDEPMGTRITAVRIATGQPVYGRGRPAKQAQRTVEKLEREGIIRKVGRGSFEFTEPLFARFVRQISARE